MGAEQISGRPALDAAFKREQALGARLGQQVRAAGLAVIAAALSLRVGGEALLYYVAILVILLASGWLFYRTLTEAGAFLGRFGPAARGALIAADMALVTIALVAPAPSAPDMWPVAMQLRIGDVGFLFLFLAFSALIYSPALAVWAGLSAAAAWLAGGLWALSQPGSFTLGAADFAAMSLRESMTALLDPNYVSVLRIGQEALLLALAGAVIAVAVWRSRRLTWRQIAAARERARLARYFSPDMVEEVTTGFDDMAQVETRSAAILFADIFSFTTFAERREPEDTLAFLREFHRMSTGAVFAHGGTLNKFIGDEVMATFGAIHGMREPASAALDCAFDLVERVAAWSERRVAAGETPVRVGVGVHFGDVVVGNIGDDRCLELAVLGDVVNVASRLQVETRAADACMVVSRRVVEESQRERPGLRRSLSRLGHLEVRGKDQTIDAFMFRGAEAAAPEDSPAMAAAT